MPRVAILGLHLEANAFAPRTTEADFRGSCYLEGDEILVEAAKNAPSMPAEIPAFIAEMNNTGEWEAIPVVIASVEPGGPAE
jgi:microcystin degradation protein MlrC